MLAKEQIAQFLRQNDDLVKDSDYTISKSDRSTVITQRALDALIKEFGEDALQEVERPQVFTRVQADY